MRSSVVAAVAAFLLAGQASAASFFINDETGFGAAAGALTEIALPDSGLVGTGPVDVDPLTFDSLSGDLYFGGVFGSTLIPGNDTAISGVENLQIDINVSTTAFRFFLVEPTTDSGLIDACNFVCVQSTFMIEAFRGGLSLGSAIFDPLDDFANFVGVFDAGGIDRVRIIETVGTADNEFFGAFAIAAVPVPAGLPLLIGGLGLLAGIGRRLRTV